MSNLPLKKVPISSEEEHASTVLKNRLQRQWTISVLQGELERIRAWNQVQKKKKDDQYLMQAGRYLKVGSDPICSDKSFIILERVWKLLKAEAQAAEKWQKVIYYTKSGHIFVSTLDSHVVIATIPVGKGSEGVAITPDHTRVYVTNRRDNTVSVIATDILAVIATIPVRESPNGIAITPDGMRVYVAAAHKTIFVIATDSHAVIATIPVGLADHAFGFTPDGTMYEVSWRGSWENFHISVATDSSKVELWGFKQATGRRRIWQ
jgi:YVTN family beta-propeller protein